MSLASCDLSAEMEDYLEAIAVLTASEGRARVKDIAARLSVRMPSVTQALHSLSEKGLLEYTPYVSPTLTRSGKAVAERVRRRHGVIRKFLVQVLLIDPEVADANACRLEHAMDKEVLDHLASFVDFMQRCPAAETEWFRRYESFRDASGRVAVSGRGGG